MPQVQTDSPAASEVLLKRDTDCVFPVRKPLVTLLFHTVKVTVPLRPAGLCRGYRPGFFPPRPSPCAVSARHTGLLQFLSSCKPVLPSGPSRPRLLLPGVASQLRPAVRIRPVLPSSAGLCRRGLSHCPACAPPPCLPSCLTVHRTARASAGQESRLLTAAPLHSDTSGLLRSSVLKKLF